MQSNVCIYGKISVVLGPVEADPEYQLIVESNNMLVELDTEISMLVASTCLQCILHIIVHRCHSQVYT